MAATSPESSCAPVTDHGLMSCSLVGLSTLSAAAGFGMGAVVVLSVAILPVLPSNEDRDKNREITFNGGDGNVRYARADKGAGRVGYPQGGSSNDSIQAGVPKISSIHTYCPPHFYGYT